MEEYKKCLKCGSLFKFNPSRPYKKFCSEKCCDTYNKTKRLIQYEYTCINCGKTYHPKEKDRNKYCSRECAFEYKEKNHICNIPEYYRKKRSIKSVERLINKFISNYIKRINICKRCGKTFLSKTHDCNFCSFKCLYRNRDEEKMVIKIYKCKECGTKFFSHSEIHKSRIVFCSNGCSRRYLKRKNEARKRVAKKNVVIESFSLYQILVRDAYICGICGNLIDISLPVNHRMSATIDHIMPLSKGGAHCWNNVQAAHLSCNAAKHNVIDYKYRGGGIKS